MCCSCYFILERPELHIVDQDIDAKTLDTLSGFGHDIECKDAKNESNKVFSACCASITAAAEISPPTRGWSSCVYVYVCCDQ